MPSTDTPGTWLRRVDQFVPTNPEQPDRPAPAVRSVRVARGRVAPAAVSCADGCWFDGCWFDEVYLSAIGRFDLDWGSVDQPLMALADAVVPVSLPRRSRSPRPRCYCPR